MAEINDLYFPCGIRRLSNGNTLISDAGNATGDGSRILEVNDAGNVVWSWADELNFAHSAVVLESGNLLIADTTNNRIVEVDREGTTLFSSDDWSGGTGALSDGSHLHYPNNAVTTDDGMFMITDRNNDRFVVTDREGNIKRSLAGSIRHPHNCEPLPDGHVIIADSDNNRVLEVNHSGDEVWTYDINLNWPRDANRLSNGNTLIVDSRNSRIIEVSCKGEIVWEYRADHFANFYEAQRLDSGNTLISDQQHGAVIEVDLEGRLVWSFARSEESCGFPERLQNGFFKNMKENGMPEHWILATRLSEGGGMFILEQVEPGQTVPGLEFDRPGALCLQQTVSVEPGAYYTMGGRIRTDDLDGMACFQMAFVDKNGGLVCDASLSPRGVPLSGSTGWCEDSFEAPAPAGASAAEVRIFITGRGKVFFNQVRFFS
jgi:hypothetical protein